MDLTTIYLIGSSIQYLKRAAYNKSLVKNENFILDNLKRTTKYLNECNLSTNTQHDIENLIKKFEESYKVDAPIKNDDVNLLDEKIKLWQDRIKNELDERIILEVFTDGTLNPNKLLNGGESFFSNNVWDMLSDIQKSDLNDACNCLLTKSWTPSVMISLRASEDSIRIFYEFKTGKNSHRKGWKSILDELGTIHDINKPLLGYLDYIRDIRNTAEHPDEIFDQMEAERFFHQVVNMIIVINQELSPKKALDELSVKELKAHLKQKKLKTSGKKMDLIERLSEYY